MAPTVSIVVGKIAQEIRARNVAVGQEKVDAPNVESVKIVRCHRTALGSALLQPPAAPHLQHPLPVEHTTTLTPDPSPAAVGIPWE